MSVEDYIAAAPVSARGTLEKAFSGQSRAAAVKAKCLTCSNYERADVTDCRVFDCPLWPWRPYQRNSRRERAAKTGIEGGLTALQRAIAIELGEALAKPAPAAAPAENTDGAPVAARRS